MDLSELSKLNLTQIAAILVIGWGGFRWLRARNREDWESEEFHAATKKGALAAMQTDEYKKHESEIVSSVVSSSFEHLNRSINDHEIRIGRLEGKVERILARLQLQRREDLEPKNPKDPPQ